MPSKMLEGLKTGLAALVDKKQSLTVEMTEEGYQSAEMVDALNNVYAKWSLLLPSYFAAALGVDFSSSSSIRNPKPETLEKYLQEVDFNSVTRHHMTGEVRDLEVVATTIVIELLMEQIVAIALEKKDKETIDKILLDKSEEILDEISRDMQKGVPAKPASVFTQEMLGKMVERSEDILIARGTVAGKLSETFNRRIAAENKHVGGAVKKLVAAQINGKEIFAIVPKEKLVGSLRVPFERGLILVPGGKKIPLYLVERYLKHAYLDKGLDITGNIEQLVSDFNKVFFSRDGIIDKVKIATAENKGKPLSDDKIDGIIRDTVFAKMEIGGPSTYVAHKESVKNAVKQTVESTDVSKSGVNPIFVNEAAAAAKVKEMQGGGVSLPGFAAVNKAPPPVPPRASAKGVELSGQPNPPPPVPPRGAYKVGDSGQPNPPPPPPPSTKPNFRGKS